MNNVYHDGSNSASLLRTRPFAGQRRWTLPEIIIALYRQGELPTPFGVEDLSQHVGPFYAPAYLSVVLANYCESTGDYVIKGSKPRFRRVSRGRYEIIEEGTESGTGDAASQQNGSRQATTDKASEPVSGRPAWPF